MMTLGYSQRRGLAGALGALGVAALLMLAGQAAVAETFKAGAISVEQPWSRATPGGAKVGAGYLAITNGAATPDRLLSATTEVAGRTEIHEMSMNNGMMQMRPLPEGVEVPASGTVALKPGATHLMLLDLKHPLKEGDRFSGILTFEKAGPLDVTFEVRGIGADAAGDGEHHH
jgi:periplasmic copper chaperone A